MSLNLENDWVWDHWMYPEQVEGQWHIYYLKAPRSLINPDLRHENATVGHSTSPDLKNWTHHGTVLVPGDAGAWNDRAIWTGSIFKGPDGLFNLFFTGTNKSSEKGLIQRVGRAVGKDLFSFQQTGLVVEADATLYERLDQNDLEASQIALEWREEAWRDPWVFFDERDGLWHMLVTARLKYGLSKNRGTVGHATSPDLENWTVQPALTGETSFAHLEVFQILKTPHGYVVVFCTSAADVDSDCDIPKVTGTFSAPADSPTGPFHFDKSELIDDGNYYAGRIVTLADGTYMFLGFENGLEHGFTGAIGDPRKVALTERRTFKVV